jgi:Tfp pilus assembly PilM family ATPase
MTDLFIYTFVNSDGEQTIEDVYTDSEAQDFIEDSDYDYVSYSKEKVDMDNCVVGWFYYNDEEDHTDAVENYFNSKEQVELYQDNWNSHGHFSLDRIDTYKDGAVVNTEMVDDRVSCISNWEIAS